MEEDNTADVSQEEIESSNPDFVDATVDTNISEGEEEEQSQDSDGSDIDGLINRSASHGFLLNSPKKEDQKLPDQPPIPTKHVDIARSCRTLNLREQSTRHLNNSLTSDEEKEYQQAIHNHALYLGIDIDVHKDLMWIAAESLFAEPTPPWREVYSSTGEAYFFNSATGTTMWEHPLDEYYRDLYLIEKAKKMNVMEGFLMKRGMTFVANWKRRFCRLRKIVNGTTNESKKNSTLDLSDLCFSITYATDPDSDPKGEIPIDHLTSVRNREDQEKMPFCFEVLGSAETDDTSLMLSAASLEERERWCSFIKSAIVAANVQWRSVQAKQKLKRSSLQHQQKLRQQENRKRRAEAQEEKEQETKLFEDQVRVRANIIRTTSMEGGETRSNNSSVVATSVTQTKFTAVSSGSKTIAATSSGSVERTESDDIKIGALVRTALVSGKLVQIRSDDVYVIAVNTGEGSSVTCYLNHSTSMEVEDSSVEGSTMDIKALRKRSIARSVVQDKACNTCTVM